MIITTKQHVSGLIPTQAPFILQSPMQPHSAWVACTQSNQSVLFCECGLQFIVSLEMILVEYFNCIFLPRGRVDGMINLYTVCEKTVYEKSGLQAYSGIRSFSQCVSEFEVIWLYFDADRACAGRLCSRFRPRLRPKLEIGIAVIAIC